MSSLTPRYALPYPDNADVPDLGYWNKRLADAVEAALYQDTGWTALTYSDNRVTVYTAGAEPKLRIKDGVATIVGQATTATAGLIDTGVTLFTLPAEARPAYRIPATMPGSGDDRWALIVSPNGVVTAERWGPSTSPSGVWLPFALSWPVG